MQRSAQPEAKQVVRIHYDGHCALCHGFVKFALRVGPEHVRFAPLKDSAARSVEVELANGERLKKSSAVIAFLKESGGLWGFAAIVFSLIPRPLRDLGYDFVARVRYRVFGQTEEACPLMPPNLRSRFDL